MSKFELKIDKSSDKFQVVLSGVIDEDMDFSTFDLAGASSVTLDLEKIKSINSCGIREWIKWISTVPSAKFHYVKCPKIIIDQINMVQGFLPASGTVESFYVPYFSDGTGDEKSVLFTLGQEYTASGELKMPEVKDADGNPMEIDVIEAKYFKFIKK